VSRTSPWLSDKPTPNVTRLERGELLDLWASNRNSLIGAMAADEMMKRLYTDRKTRETET
jgi:hypothetical protein